MKNFFIESDYNHEEVDRQCIEIYNILHEAYQRCQTYGGPYLNLAGLFFHELIFIFSSALFRNRFYENDEDGQAYVKSDFDILENPYFGYRKHKKLTLDSFKVSYRKKILTNLSLLTGKPDWTIGFLNPSLNFKKFCVRVLCNRISILFPENILIDLPNIEKQKKIVEDTIACLYNDFKMYGNPDKIISRMNKTLEKIISPNVPKPDYSLLLTGTLGKLNMKILAANALSKDIPVVCMAHGNECGTADHLNVAYNDRSYSSHYIGYGKAGLLKINQANFLNTLHGKQPVYFEGNSQTIRKAYNKRPILPLSKIESSEIAYVPLKLLGFNRLPFLNIPDEHYINWQQYLFKVFPEMTFKKHPKQIIEHQLNEVKSISERLEDCLDRFDVFMLDFALSTAFANIAATSKPVIYFNIGQGRMTPKAEEIIRRRCIWIDVDYKNPGDILEKIESQKDKQCYNAYTELFSLADHAETREQTAVRVIKEILNS